VLSSDLRRDAFGRLMGSVRYRYEFVLGGTLMRASTVIVDSHRMALIP